MPGRSWLCLIAHDCLIRVRLGSLMYLLGVASLGSWRAIDPAHETEDVASFRDPPRSSVGPGDIFQSLGRRVGVKGRRYAIGGGAAGPRTGRPMDLASGVLETDRIDLCPPGYASGIQVERQVLDA